MRNPVLLETIERITNPLPMRMPRLRVHSALRTRHQSVRARRIARNSEGLTALHREPGTPTVPHDASANRSTRLLASLHAANRPVCPRSGSDSGSLNRRRTAGEERPRGARGTDDVRPLIRCPAMMRLDDPNDYRRDCGRCEAIGPTADWAAARFVLHLGQDDAIQRHHQETGGHQHQGGDAIFPVSMHHDSRRNNRSEHHGLTERPNSLWEDVGTDKFNRTLITCDFHGS